MKPYFDKTQNRGIAHLANATRFSITGLGNAFRYESAFRQEVALLAILSPVGFWLADSPVEFAILMASGGAVLVVELLNSAVEAVVDRTGTEYHELAGRAKDYGSAAVMVALVCAGAIWAAFLYRQLVA